jgi:beta-galactosidase
VDLPHDWAVEDYGVQDSMRTGPFLKDQEMGDDVGYLRGGTGWYRKTFQLEEKEKEKVVFLHFDGVQTEMKLWVNGSYVGEHVYGYTPFYFDITPWLNRAGTPNNIAIQVVNPGKNSRWYNGSGIYREVRLSLLNPVFLDIWGMGIQTYNTTDSESDVSVDLKYTNQSGEEVDFTLRTEIFSPSGRRVGIQELKGNSGPNGGGTRRIEFSITNPQMWSPDHPALYTARATLIRGKEIMDRAVSTFGIRSILYSSEKGFLLNGKEILLKGACMHHDNGLLGAAAFKRAEERRVEVMKRNGYNAIRTSHNPPSDAFLDACDRLGMLVIDESFDMWEQPKRPNDYHLHFKQWWERDLQAMLMRDRNHPSVIMWSFGNEVRERANEPGIELARKMISVIRSIDPARPITQAICGFWDNPGKSWDASAPAFELLDIGGYNYQWQNYESDHEKYPDRIMFGSESVPMEAYENWHLVETLPYVIGDFVWTGLDYIGESGIGHSLLTEDNGQGGSFLMPWPWYVSWCGDIDITGNKKPQSYYRDVLWGESNLEILVHEPIPPGTSEKISFWGWPREHRHWNWEVPTGTPLVAHVYTRYPAVRLELNGALIGEQQLSDTSRLTAIFTVPYETGELRAIGIRNGVEMEEAVLRTSGPVTGLQLIPEKESIAPGPGEIGFVQLIATDKNGEVVPGSEIPVIIRVSGEGTLLSAGSGSPLAQGSLKDPLVRLYDGRALVIVRSNGKPGTISIEAALGENKAIAETTIDVKSR